MHERRIKWNKNEQLENKNYILDIENTIVKKILMGNLEYVCGNFPKNRIKKIYIYI